MIYLDPMQTTIADNRKNIHMVARSIKFKGEAVTNRMYTILTIRRCYFVNSHSQTEVYFSFSMYRVKEKEGQKLQGYYET